MKYKFKTEAPLVYVDKKLGTIINFNCYGFIELENENDNIQNIVLDNLQGIFNNLSTEYSFNEIIEEPLFKEILLKYFGNILKDNKILDINISSIVPVNSSAIDLVNAKAMLCKNCGHKLKKGEIFCSECGTKNESK